MDKLRDVTEDEVVAEFLKGEVDSERFSEELLKACEALEVNKNTIINPDISNRGENELRHKVLAKYRGWRENRALFTDFPEKVQWMLVQLTIDELLDVYYVDYSYWNDLSKGTRLVSAGVKSVREGVEVFNISNDGFWKVATNIEAGLKLPRLILFEKNVQKLQLLEGHLRATAYGLAKKRPDNIEVFIGRAVN